jgi:hypothetical protein
MIRRSYIGSREHQDAVQQVFDGFDDFVASRGLDLERIPTEAPLLGKGFSSEVYQVGSLAVRYPFGFNRVTMELQPGKVKSYVNTLAGGLGETGLEQIRAASLCPAVVISDCIPGPPDKQWTPEDLATLTPEGLHATLETLDAMRRRGLRMDSGKGRPLITDEPGCNNMILGGGRISMVDYLSDRTHTPAQAAGALASIMALPYRKHRDDPEAVVGLRNVCAQHYGRRHPATRAVRTVLDAAVGLAEGKRQMLLQ